MPLKNHQYDTIIREYDARRLQSKYNLDKRTEEIYNKYPMILDIDNRIAEDSVRRAKLAILGDEKALEGLSESNRALSEMKEKLLIKYGYPANYLQPHYICEQCKDTGYIGSEKCSCFKLALSRLIYSESNIKDIIETENFDTFSPELYSDLPADRDPLLGTPRENIMRVLKQAKDFISNFDSSYQNLLIYGNTGVGKTFLSNCIAKELLDTAHTVQYYTTYQFYNMLEKYKFKYDEYKEEAPGRQDYILDCDLLILDDLGTEMTNAFTASQLYAVINERHLSRKSTIISTNLSFENIESFYSERVFSRLSKDYTFLKIIGQDIRLL